MGNFENWKALISIRLHVFMSQQAAGTAREGATSLFDLQLQDPDQQVQVLTSKF